jgi:ABC-type multidrug transport system ATPase subunit
MSAAPAPVFEALGLRKTYGGAHALDALDLVVGPGERVLVLGPNGAGKTTLLRIASTLLSPTAGRMRLFASDERGAAARRRIGFLGHRTLLYDHLSAAENLDGVEEPGDAARAALGAVGLGSRAEDETGNLSRGQRQRVAIARTLLHRPDLLLLDEPFTGLDREGARILADLLGRALGAAGACLLVTHDLSGALQIATRLVVLRRGRVSVDRETRGLDVAAVLALLEPAA